MRYHIVISNGDRVATNFDKAHPVRNEEGDLVPIAATMFWCRAVTNVARPGSHDRWQEHGPLLGRAIPDHAVVSIIDMDCG